MIFASHYIASSIETVETKFRRVHYSLIRIYDTGSITSVPIDPNKPLVPSLEIGAEILERILQIKLCECRCEHHSIVPLRFLVRRLNGCVRKEDHYRHAAKSEVKMWNHVSDLVLRPERKGQFLADGVFVVNNVLQLIGGSRKDVSTHGVSKLVS